MIENSKKWTADRVTATATGCQKVSPFVSIAENTLYFVNVYCEHPGITMGRKDTTPDGKKEDPKSTRSGI